MMLKFYYQLNIYRRDRGIKKLERESNIRAVVLDLVFVIYRIESNRIELEASIKFRLIDLELIDDGFYYENIFLSVQ